MLGVTGGPPLVDQLLALIDAGIADVVNVPALDEQTYLRRSSITESTGRIRRDVFDILG